MSIQLIKNNFTVTESTQLITPAKTVDYQTIIYEGDRELKVKKTPKEIIDHTCLQNWTTFDGFRKAIMKMSGYEKKVPLPLRINPRICLFPSGSPEAHDTVWISPFHLKTPNKAVKYPNNPRWSIITFESGKEMTLQVSANVINNQIKRAYKCFYMKKSFQEDLHT